MNSKGFTLTSATIAMLIGSIVMGAVGGLLVLGTKYQEDLNSNFDYLNYTQMLKGHLNIDCSETLQGLPTANDTAISSLNNKAGSVVLSTSTHMPDYNNIKIQSLSLKNITPTNTPTTQGGTGDILVHLLLEDKKIGTKERGIHINFHYEGSATISRCEFSSFELGTTKNIWSKTPQRHLNTNATQFTLGNVTTAVTSALSGLNLSGGFFFTNDDGSPPSRAIYLSSSTDTNLVVGDMGATQPSTDGRRNTLLGPSLGQGLAGSDNVLLGQINMSTPSDQNTVLGFNNLIANSYNTVIGNNNTVRGEHNLIVTSGFTSLTPASTTSENVVIGYSLGQEINNGFANVLVGGKSCRFCDPSESVIIGADLGGVNTATPITASESVVIGSRTGKNLLRTTNDIFIGANIVPFQQSIGNIFVGSNTPFSPTLPATPFNVRDNIIIGNDIGVESPFSDANLLAIGSDLIRVHESLSNSIIIGTNIGNNLQTGNRNILIGHDFYNTQTNLSNELRVGNFISGNLNSRIFNIGGNTEGLLPARITFIHPTANCILDGSLSCSSDENLKFKIKPLSRAKQALDKLDSITYTWKGDNKRKQIGLIAQDVEKVYPELIFESEQLKVKKLKYEGLSAPIVQELISITKKRLQWKQLQDDLKVSSLEVHSQWSEINQLIKQLETTHEK